MDEEDIEMTSLSVDEPGVYVSPEVLLMSYMRDTGETGLGFRFRVFDLDKASSGDPEFVNVINVVMDSKKWLPKLLQDLLDFFVDQSTDPDKAVQLTIVELNEVLNDLQKRIGDANES